MEEQLSPVAVTHLLQHTLRSLCTSGADDSQWVYAVFWRILPRNYPPPKWDLPGGAYDRTRGNRRNWILAWEDGFCNFAATSAACGGQDGGAAAAAYGAAECEAAAQDAAKQACGGGGLQPELFFKMSHDIYNYGEGLIGKVAADHSHKWVFKEPQEQEINLISSWSNPADSHPRTWEAQFQSGIQTIALIAVREGVVQLGSMKKVAEDLSYVVALRRKFGYLESIPGVLLPHPSSAGATAPFPGGGCVVGPPDAAGWPGMMPPVPPELYVDPYGAAAAAAAAAAAGPPASMQIMPSMSSLEALLSKLPSVVPAPSPPPPGSSMPQSGGAAAASSAPVAAKEEADQDDYVQCHGMADDMATNGGESTSSAAATPLPSSYFVNVGVKPSEGF
ncbi:protein RICE SALT SENSITIVE 3-like [Oryza brachyantha]|uniref:protein RICE SALT SENSITIVE 3-like n=1 Tax=Oryza brachyantha TaxID=4533 RepID=UPI001ADA360C|nr:protein RICE SALT SENSITIVE 3-like [Oryza brachyantha]